MNSAQNDPIRFVAPSGYTAQPFRKSTAIRRTLWGLILFQQKVIIALECDELCAGNFGGQLTPRSPDFSFHRGSRSTFLTRSNPHVWLQ